jgi:hypothetical protein
LIGLPFGMQKLWMVFVVASCATRADIPAATATLAPVAASGTASEHTIDTGAVKLYFQVIDGASPAVLLEAPVRIRYPAR